jgi:hypothetical protein
MQRNTDELEESPNPPDLFTATLAAVRGVDHLVSRVTRPQALQLLPQGLRCDQWPLAMPW